jgi:hypothetical protein
MIDDNRSLESHLGQGEVERGGREGEGSCCAGKEKWERGWRVHGAGGVTPLVLQELKLVHSIICIDISLCMLHLECIHYAKISKQVVM